MEILLIVTLLIGFAVADHQLRIFNRCQQTLWIGILNNPGKALPADGGFRLNAHNQRTVTVHNGWGGRVWARTKCDNNGRNCATGECGGDGERCRGTGGRPPVSLAEITFDGHGNKDYYDISLVDGYNVQVSMAPVPGSWTGSGDAKYYCKRAGCNSDLNAICPGELQLRRDNRVVGCKSACEAFNTDQYCCRGQWGCGPSCCNNRHWPRNYPQVFKQACPLAYSYAYDDELSTFTCRGNPTHYDIVFCG